MQEGACDWLFEDVVEVDNAREETFSHLTTVAKGLIARQIVVRATISLVFVSFLTWQLNCIDLCDDGCDGRL